MSKYHDDRTVASNPIYISISNAKLRRFHPELYGWRSWFRRIPFGSRRMRARELRTMLHEHVQEGDSRAAIVVKLSSLIVAAYTDEQGTIVLLQFPNHLANEYRLNPGDRLLTVNTCSSGTKLAPDIVAGPLSTGRWNNFYPIIAEFVSTNEDAIVRRKLTIADAEWQRASSMALAAMRTATLVRDGRPLYSMYPAHLTDRQ